MLGSSSYRTFRGSASALLRGIGVSWREVRQPFRAGRLKQRVECNDDGDHRPLEWLSLCPSPVTLPGEAQARPSQATNESGTNDSSRRICVGFASGACAPQKLDPSLIPQFRPALLHGPEQIADLPVPVVESPGAVRIGHPERGHLVEYLAPNSVFNSLPRQRSCPHLGPDDRFVTIDRVLHHASLGAA